VKVDSLRPEFVEFMPADLQEGVLYISIPYGTVIHLCCSGCGQKVVTPLRPTDWSLIYDGEAVSLSPSIGNWGFDCQSHYWIKRNRVVPAPRWSRERIEAGRGRDRSAKERFFAERNGPELPGPTREATHRPKRWWRRIWRS
jgi:integrase